MKLIHCKIITFSPFLSVVTKLPYISGSISRSKSTRTPQILMTGISFYFSTRVWMSVLGIYITATSLLSSASIRQENSIYLFDIVGELESSLKMKSLFLFHSSAVIYLIVISIFSLRNI